MKGPTMGLMCLDKEESCAAFLLSTEDRTQREWLQFKKTLIKE